MKLEQHGAVAILRESGVWITSGQSALDLIATVQLSTSLAGEVLQKFVNYQMRLAVVGDFSCCTSPNLRDFLFESNKGGAVYFLPDEAQALERLGG